MAGGTNDLDFLNSEPPEDTTSSGGAAVDEANQGGAAQDEVLDAPVIEDTGTGADEPQIQDDATVSADDTGGEVDETNAGGDDKAGKDDQTPKDEADKTGVETPSADAEPDYKAFYEKVMKRPLKANGKSLEIKSEDEVLSLMSQGADYTQKTQQLAGRRKMLTMLEKNGLLDEGKLDYLIALDKKDPEAIRKLLKDSELDPLEIDVSTEATYIPGSHSVTDDEVNFRSIASDVTSRENGWATLQEVNSWDQASKDVVFASPEVLHVIYDQRETGVYDLVKSEIDRRKTVGAMASNVPFMTAYTMVGKEMADAAIAEDPTLATPQDKGAGQGSDATQRQPVVRKEADVKKETDNDAKARAAATNRTTSDSGKQGLVNTNKMSDEQFLKSMGKVS